MQYLSLSIFYALTWPDLIRNFSTHIINEGRGFRGGSDEKMRRMWLGREVVVASLPPLPQWIKFLMFFLKNGIASKICGNASKSCNTSAINIGKQLKNIRKYLALFHFLRISQKKAEIPQKWILEWWDISMVRRFHSTVWTTRTEVIIRIDQ